MADIILIEGNNVLDVQLVPVTPPVANLFGRVTDAETNLPIPAVKIIINGLTIYSDADGNYFLAGLTPGSYTIQFSKEGYETLVR